MNYVFCLGIYGKNMALQKRLVVSKFLMEAEYESSKTFNIMMKLTFGYAILNPILGAVNFTIASMGGFNTSIVMAGTISSVTVLVTLISSLIFRITLAKKFSGAYIDNVSFKDCISNLTLAQKNYDLDHNNILSQSSLRF